MSASQYQPGVCNIGGAEVNRRKRVSQVGAVFFLLFSIYAVAEKISVNSGALAFFPAMIAAVGYVQARKKFCFAFGLMGTFNFFELGKMSKVATVEDIAADRKQALTIILQSLTLALLATALLLLALAL